MKRVTIAAVVVWVLLAVPPLSATPAAASCAAPPPAVTFVGRVTSIDRSDVTFRVEQVVIAPADPDHLGIGDDAFVDHGDDAGLLEVGTSYRVQTSGRADEWASHVAAPDVLGTDGPCDGRLTTQSDGTPIETNWFVRHHGGTSAIAALAAMVTLVAVVEIARAISRRRLARRAPR